jgi:hypothetical protein
MGSYEECVPDMVAATDGASTCTAGALLTSNLSLPTSGLLHMLCPCREFTSPSLLSLPPPPERPGPPVQRSCGQPSPAPHPQSHVSTTENARETTTAGCLAGSLILGGTHFGVGQLASGWVLGSQLLGNVSEHSCSQLPTVTGQEGPQHAIHLTCSEKGSAMGPGHLPVIPGPAGSLE